MINICYAEEQVACMEEYDQYIPPLWIMCLESVAHLLVMLNFSTNFLIYCSVSAPFKRALPKVIRIRMLIVQWLDVLDQWEYLLRIIEIHLRILCVRQRGYFGKIWEGVTLLKLWGSPSLGWVVMAAKSQTRLAVCVDFILVDNESWKLKLFSVWRKTKITIGHWSIFYHTFLILVNRG